MENLANIRVLVIAAIEERDHVHSEYALLAGVMVAAEAATFHDILYFRRHYTGRWNFYDLELSR